jgi:cyclohexadieny/prephenate dehydrogenase
MIFQQITIIGFGLVGSSLARAVRKHNLAQKIVCVDASESVCARVMELGLADVATTDMAQGVGDADCVVVSVPAGAFSAVGAAMREYLKEGCIVTDAGSVKQSAIAALAPHIPPQAFFVPDAGFAELFERRWCILTPLPETPLRAVEKITALWEGCGAMIEIMEARRHDLTLAVTSHLPHLIAYTIVGTAADLEDDLRADVIRFSASGFRDFTRIAASDPIMWRDIFLANREAVLEMLQRLNEDLSALQKAIRQGDGQALQDKFTRTRAIRRQVIDAGQADYPKTTFAKSPLEDEPATKVLRKASGS